MRKKLIGIVGSGMIGRDPWDGKCWSNSATPFFKELQAADILYKGPEGAFGVEASPLARYGLLALNFRKDRNLWWNQFHLDPRYYAALTSSVQRRLIRLTENIENFGYLQIGSIYDLPALTRGRTPVYSYNDGNLACRMRSPYWNPLFHNAAKKALEWEKRVNQSLTQVFTMSEYLRRSFIEDYGVSPDRVISVNVGMNFPVPGESVLDKDYSRQNIVFIGVDFERKGGPDLVEAFDRLSKKYPKSRLHIIGPSSVPKAIPKAIQDANNDQIIFHGFLKRQDARFAEVMSSGTLAVLPSLYEPFGIALLESMTYGMPGIATDQWAFPEIVEPGQNGRLVPAQSPPHLAEALDYYLADPDRMAREGRIARGRVLAKYGWDKVAANLKKAIET